MSLSALHEGLFVLSEKDRSLSADDVSDRFAELILDPFSIGSKVSDDVSNLLRGCLLDNDPINRVYETIGDALCLKHDGKEAEFDLEGDFRRFCDQDFADDDDRKKALLDGSAFRSCVRTLLYMRKYGQIPDLGKFFDAVDEEFDTTGSVTHHNRYVYLAKVLYLNVRNVGRKDELAEKLFVKTSIYRLRAVPDA